MTIHHHHNTTTIPKADALPGLSEEKKNLSDKKGR